MTITSAETGKSQLPPPHSSIREVVDGNEAAARIAHLASEVIAIYPITPASPMGEFADDWSAKGRTNLWGAVPEVIEMQSEAGAAGTLHGAVTRGALGTTFTASQGLLLMLPNMFKIAGELTPTVIHVAARTIATHALSIFGDHSDVMAARTTGFAMLCASSVQETADFAAVAHATTLATRIPFLHFFDGFRTSHEIGTIEVPTADDLRAMIDPAAVAAHRARGLDPDRPVLRGSAQNPDVFFQAREACNTFYDKVPGAVQASMDQLATLTGRHYHLVDYHGAPDADRVIVLMGSGAGATKETVDELCRGDERVGVAVIRLFRPFPTEALLAALPPTHANGRRARPDQGAGRAVRAVAPRRPVGSVAQLGRFVGRRPYTSSDRRTLRAQQQGVHSGDGQGGLRRGSEGRPAQWVHHRDHRRHHPHQPDLRSVVHH